MADLQHLLDLPPFPVDGYARLADRIAALLSTTSDVLLVQAEAVVALEAAATSLATPATRALNVITSPYGHLFGGWLRRGGARVTDLVAAPGMPVSEAAFAAALAERPETNLIAVVHAESASGILNPLPAIARLSRNAGALLLVDAVASAGGHELDVDALGIDIAVVGPQKALGGPAGVSALSVSPRAWAVIERPDAPVQSVLSLADLKRNWLETGRGVLAGMPSTLEFHALRAALDRVEAETLAGVIRRHANAAAAARAGLRALGATLWIEDDRQASNLVTALLLPDGIDAGAACASATGAGAGLSPGVGAVADRIVRLTHTGASANRDAVLAGVRAIGALLAEAGVRVDPRAGEAAVAATYAGNRLSLPTA